MNLVFQKFNLEYEKLISITSDGAKNLQGEDNGLIALIKIFMSENNMKNQITNFHCLLHQEDVLQKT